MQIDDAIDGYLLFKSGRASDTTIETDNILLGQFADYVGSVNVEVLTASDILAYLRHNTERGLAPSTNRRHHAILSALWSWMVSDEIGLVKSNVVSKVPPPRLPKRRVKVLSDEDIANLLSAAGESENALRDKALILSLLDTCARASEITGVTVDDVDLSLGRVRVIGKGDKERYVHLGRPARQAVWLYIKKERPEPVQYGSDHLFLTREAYPMNRDSLRKAIERLGDRTEIHVYPHLFRHTGAVARLLRGMDLETLKLYLGHESITTTSKYLTALEDDDVQAVAQRTAPSEDYR